jgi:hypothetical protein
MFFHAKKRLSVTIEKLVKKKQAPNREPAGALVSRRVRPSLMYTTTDIFRPLQGTSPTKPKIFVGMPAIASACALACDKGRAQTN